MYRECVDWSQRVIGVGEICVKVRVHGDTRLSLTYLTDLLSASL